MLNAAVQQRGDLLTVKLSGSLEENVDFSVLIGAAQCPRMEVNLKDVFRINSIGVKAWMKYFQVLQSKGVQVRFIECSPAIVEQMNLIMNFTCGGVVDSLYLPYLCGDCKTEFLGLFRAADAKKLGFKMPDLPCPKCKGVATFDDVSQEYFGFLNRRV